MKNLIELKQKLLNLGFSDFESIEEAENKEYDFNYIIDIVPFRLKINEEHFYENSSKSSFNTIEDFYSNELNYKILKNKWFSLLFKLSYYYKLRKIYVYGLSSPEDECIENLTDSIGFYLVYSPLLIMENLEKFITFSSNKLNNAYYLFEFDNFTIHLFLDELFLALNFSANEEEVINNIKLLVKSEGLFLSKICNL